MGQRAGQHQSDGTRDKAAGDAEEWYAHGQQDNGHAQHQADQPQNGRENPEHGAEQPSQQSHGKTSSHELPRSVANVHQVAGEGEQAAPELQDRQAQRQQQDGDAQDRADQPHQARNYASTTPTTAPTIPKHHGE
jgi:hypothetical protein